MKSILKSLVFVATSVIGSLVLAHGGHDHPPIAGHLSFKQDSLHIHASFPRAPVLNDETLLVLEAKDAKTHKAIELNDNIGVELWMPSMGHGSAPTQVERAIDADGNILTGIFNVRNVFFVMGGDWDVQVTLTDADGVQETQSFKVSIGGGHDHGGGH